MDRANPQSRCGRPHHRRALAWVSMGLGAGGMQGSPPGCRSDAAVTPYLSLQGRPPKGGSLPSLTLRPVGILTAGLWPGVFGKSRGPACVGALWPGGCSPPQPKIPAGKGRKPPARSSSTFPAFRGQSEQHKTGLRTCSLVITFRGNCL